MKIFDCFQFFDEEMLLDLRLNIMDKYVDKFVITEATYMHNGKPNELCFDIKKYQKFKDKIIYIVVDKQPSGIHEINNSDDDEEDTKGQKLILNGYMRDNYQREMAQEYLKNVNDNDWIIINDIDEIPNLKNIDFRKISNKLVFFKQQIFFYKFNLHDKSSVWFGSRACKKKNFISPQWLRDVKTKKYNILRIDTLLSKKKYIDNKIIDDGGWHFTNIKSPENIQRKLLNYTHHDEFERSGIDLKGLKKKIEEKTAIYDHTVDQRLNKFNKGQLLEKVDLIEMPDYLKDNFKKYFEWLET